MINFLIVEPQMAICGNGVVEEGEECDCGWEEDCLEDCCWPQRTKYAANQVHFAHKTLNIYLKIIVKVYIWFCLWKKSICSNCLKL